VRAVTQNQMEPTTAEILALLRDSSLKPESIVEEMRCAQSAQPCTPDQIARARELLGRIAAEEVAAGAGLEPQGPTSLAQVAAEVGALPEPLALALVHAASDGRKSQLLAEIAAVAPKLVAKEAKRELQRLKQKGVQVQEVRSRAEPVMKPVPEAEAPPCLVSSIDAYGERAVWWTRATKGGVEVVQAVVSDVKGVLAVDALSLPRRAFRDFLRRLPRGGMVTTAEVPKDWARHLIAAAEEEGVRNGFSPPPAYLEALRVLGPAPLTPPSPPGEEIDLPAEQEAEQAQAGASLYGDPLFAAWIPEEEELRAFALKLDEIAVSRLYLDDAQKKQAMYEAAEDAAVGYFTPQRRSRYARRLLEMAHVLRSERRTELARVALAVSRALPGENGDRNSFARGLFVHALEQRFARGREGPQHASSALVRPP
jgi:hypothetical protein